MHSKADFLFYQMHTAKKNLKTSACAAMEGKRIVV